MGPTGEYRTFESVILGKYMPYVEISGKAFTTLSNPPVRDDEANVCRVCTCTCLLLFTNFDFGDKAPEYTPYSVPSRSIQLHTPKQPHGRPRRQYA